MRDKVKENITIFGWVRYKWTECGLNNHLFPPEYLLRIMCGYYVNEWVHLLTCREKDGTGGHYKIDDIIA